MPVNVLMSVLCPAGIAFNMRFFVALCDKRNRWAFRVRLRADSNDEAMPEERENKQTAHQRPKGGTWNRARSIDIRRS